MLRVAIIDSSDNCREITNVICEAVNGISVVGSYGDYRTAIRKVAATNPEVMIIKFGDFRFDEIVIISSLKKAVPDSRVLLLAPVDDNRLILQAIKVGVTGYLPVSVELPEFTRAIKGLVNDELPICNEVLEVIINHLNRNPSSPLTKREMQVLDEMAHGKSYNYIAESLQIGTETVKTHVKHIYDKLQVNNKDDAIRTAREQRFI
ncbi:MAG: response regulator transcription factor [Cyclobacteriaceae bacterium]